MSSRDERSTNLEDILTEKDTIVPEDNDPQPLPAPTWRERPHAPNPFPERSAMPMPLAETPLRETQGLETGVITNRLDEQEHAYVMAEEIARQR